MILMFSNFLTNFYNNNQNATILKFVSSLIFQLEMSAKAFQFHRVTSYPYQLGSDPTRLHETFLGWDRNGITFESDTVWIPIADPNVLGPVRSSGNKRKAYPLQFGYESIWIQSLVNGALTLLQKFKSGVS